MPTKTEPVAGEPRSEPTDPRILFAAERTLLAYVRTGLALMGFGFVVARFGLFLRQLALDAKIGKLTDTTGLSLLLGTALMSLGVVLCVGAAPWYLRTVARLRRGEGYEPSPYGLAMMVTVGVSAIGLLMVVYLLSLR